MSEEIDRKIAVIFTTDVVSYSKHMEANESVTVKTLRVCEKSSRNFLKSTVDASLILEVTHSSQNFQALSVQLNVLSSFKTRLKPATP